MVNRSMESVCIRSQVSAEKFWPFNLSCGHPAQVTAVRDSTGQLGPNQSWFYLTDKSWWCQCSLILGEQHYHTLLFAAQLISPPPGQSEPRSWSAAVFVSQLPHPCGAFVTTAAADGDCIPAFLTWIPLLLCVGWNEPQKSNFEKELKASCRLSVLLCLCCSVPKAVSRA